MSKVSISLHQKVRVIASNVIDDCGYVFDFVCRHDEAESELRARTERWINDRFEPRDADSQGALLNHFGPTIYLVSAGFVVSFRREL